MNSTLAGALAAVKLGMPVVHVEAGLRSRDWTMPEEHNRRLTDHVSSLLLTHSESADANLRSEGIPAERIALVGNTMIDTLLENVDAARELAAWTAYGLERGGYLLVTLHRPALVDDPDLLRQTVEALDSIAAELPVLFPAHPRTVGALDRLSLIPGRMRLTQPLSYCEFLSLKVGARGVVTDSGGLQEETTALGIPCFTYPGQHGATGDSGGRDEHAAWARPRAAAGRAGALRRRQSRRGATALGRSSRRAEEIESLLGR